MHDLFWVATGFGLAVFLGLSGLGMMLMLSNSKIEWRIK